MTMSVGRRLEGSLDRLTTPGCHRCSADARRGRAWGKHDGRRLMGGVDTRDRLWDNLTATGLPVADRLDELTSLPRGGRLVVEAPPGTGKTTLIPAALAALGYRRVVCTQPRRVAAQSAAARIAEITHTRLGDLAGYTVRGAVTTKRNTPVDQCTAQILTRRLVDDPFASDIDAIVIDEVHEHSLASDIALALAEQAQSAREDLLLVAMSATLDAAGLADLLKARTWRVEAPVFPLDITWEPIAHNRPMLGLAGADRGFLDHVARVAAREVETERGDVLVFVASARDVDLTARAIAAAVPSRRVDTLHGRLPFEHQRRVLAAHTGPARVIVSTSLAESSVTIPGVRCVVDSGLAREPYFSAARGIGGLATVSESRASGTQRAGRAAREAPGRTIRCFSEAHWARMPAFTPPEAAASDLTDAALTLAAWGAPRGIGLALAHPLPTPALDSAEATLALLGAIDDDGHPTPQGRRLLTTPTSVRHARALEAGSRRAGVRRAAEVVAALSLGLRAPDADMRPLLSALRAGGHPSSNQWRRLVTRLERECEPVTDADLAGQQADAWVLACAYPDRIAKARGGMAQGESARAYGLTGGTGAALPATSPLAVEEWIVVADLAVSDNGVAGASGALVRAGLPIDAEDARLAGECARHSRLEADIVDARVRVREIDLLGAIELSRRPVGPSAQAVRELVSKAVEKDTVIPGGSKPAIIEWPASALRLHARLLALHRALGQPWPDVSREALTRSASQWLAPVWQALAAGRAADSRLLLACLRGLIPWQEVARFDELAPETLELPSGRNVELDYGLDGSVTARAKLQECFGWRENPAIADGRIRVVVDLLDPAGRIVAHSADLGFFWREVYPSVRAEKRGRYPKHPWPEDPLSATATAKTNARRPRK